MKKLINDESGESNFVSIVIILILTIVAIVLFKPYVSELVSWMDLLFL